MISFRKHERATCPECDAELYFGTKEEASGWKVYYECRGCPFDRMAGWIRLAEINHRDEVYESAEEFGDRWT